MADPNPTLSGVLLRTVKVGFGPAISCTLRVVADAVAAVVAAWPVAGHGW